MLYALTSASEFMPNLTHLQLFRVIMLAIKINKISYPFAKAFLDCVNAFDREAIVELFANFDHHTATNYMFTLSSLKDLLSQEVLHTHLKESTLTTIIEIVIPGISIYIFYNHSLSIY